MDGGRGDRYIMSTKGKGFRAFAFAIAIKRKGLVIHGNATIAIKERFMVKWSFFDKTCVCGKSKVLRKNDELQ